MVQRGTIQYSKLVVMNFSKSDIGDYKCVARNHGGIENENVIRLIRPEGIFYYINVFITKP